MVTKFHRWLPHFSALLSDFPLRALRSSLRHSDLAFSLTDVPRRPRATPQQPASNPRPNPRAYRLTESPLNRPRSAASDMANPRIHRRTHISAPLLLYAVVSMLIAVGAFNSQNNLLFWLFSLSLGMLIVSGVLSGMMLMATRIERLTVPPQQCGGPLMISYKLSNVGRFMPSFALYLDEIISAAAEEISPTDDALGQLDSPPQGFVPFIPVGGSVVARTTARATARGRVRVLGVRVTSSFPFGVVRKSMFFEMPSSFVVLPLAVPATEMETNRPDRQKNNLHAAGFAPGGDDTFGLREYRDGDSQRRIAWRSTARTGELRTRLMVSSTEQPLVVRLAVEADAAAAAIDLAVSKCAAIIHDAAAKRQPYGLLLPDGGRISARLGRQHLETCMTRLALVSRVVPRVLPRAATAGDIQPAKKEGEFVFATGGGNGFANSSENGATPAAMFQRRESADIIVSAAGQDATVRFPKREAVA